MLDTAYDTAVPFPSEGTMLTAMWTGTCDILGFFVGGWSYFLTFGGWYFIAVPRAFDYGEFCLLFTENFSLTICLAHRVKSLLLIS